MTDLVSVLSRAERIIICLEARLNNTLFSQWGFEDMVCGDVQVAGLDTSIEINSNSRVLITGGRSKHSGASDVITGGIQYQQILSDPWQGGFAQSIGKINIAFLHGVDQLNFRDWDNKDVTLSVGGVVDGVEMEHSDYPTLFDGVSLGHDNDEKSMQVALSFKSKHMGREFPPNILTGFAKGQTTPVIYGFVRNYSPIDLDNGLYHYNDNDVIVAQGVDKAYNTGDELTLVVPSDFDTDTPATGTYYDNGYQVKVNPNDDMLLTLDINGANIITLPNADNQLMWVIFSMVGLATDSRVTVNYKGDDGSPTSLYATTENVGIVLDKKKPIRDWLKDILTPLDIYAIESTTNDAIEIKRRYNGKAIDINGDSNTLDSFVFNENNIIEGSVKRIRSEYRPQSTQVLYNRNLTVLTNKDVPSVNRRAMRSDWDRTDPIVTGVGNGEPLVIKTVLIDEADAIALNELAAHRASQGGQRCTMRLYDVGHGVVAGQVGAAINDIIPTNKKTQIMSYKIDTATRETDLTVVVHG